MNKSLRLLRHGFESSCSTTQEFLNFVRTFRSEFTKELKSIGATDIQIGKGHFYVSGFFTVDGQAWYFSLSDVRGMEYCLNQSCMGKLLYRTAKDYRDFTGGYNRYATIETGMAKNMCWSFKVVE
jgi:hypothetical protein